MGCCWVRRALLSDDVSAVCAAPRSSDTSVGSMLCSWRCLAVVLVGVGHLPVCGTAEIAAAFSGPAAVLLGDGLLSGHRAAAGGVSDT